MIIKRFGKLLADLHFKVFTARRENEIHHIFSQVHGRADSGFPFATMAQMNQQTEARNLRVLLDLIDKQCPEMGSAYGNAFRYLLYRDIYARLELYLRHIQTNIPASSRVQAFTY
jgi:hypothetical protein